MNKFIITLFLGLIAYSVFSQTYSVSSIPKELTENANAVVRLDETNVVVENQRSLIITENRVVTVMNKNGERYINARVHYTPSIKVKKVEATILDANGNEIEKFKEKDFVDRSIADGFSLFNDDRIKYLNYVATSYPYTVVFSCEVKNPNTAFISSWDPVYSYYVGTEKSIFELHVAPELGLRNKEVNFESYKQIQKEEFPDGYKYTLTNQKAMKPEGYSPPDEELFPLVRFALSKFNLEGVDGEASDWASFGKWMYDNLLAETFDLSDATKNKMKQLVADKPTVYEKAKAIYEYVQKNTRYISIQVGIGGWKPMKASEVDNLGYGDCKALSNYTLNLLKAVDIPAYYTVIHAGNEKEDIDEDFYSVQGNHIILEIPTEERTVWVDCTSQSIPFDFIGDFTDDRNALVLKPDGGEIVRTCAYLNDDNLQITSGSYSIDAEGTLTGNANIKTYGIQYDSRFHLPEYPKDDQDKYYKKYLSNINNLIVKSIAFENDKSKIEFTETLEIEANNYVSFSGATGLFVPNAFNNFDSTPERYRDRTTPLYIERGFLDKDSYEINLSENYKVETLPEPVEEAHDFGTYKMSVAQNGNKLIYTRELALKAGTYPKEKYEEFRQFMRVVSKSDNSKVVINK